MSDDSECFRDMFAQHFEFMKQGTFIDVSFKVDGTKIGAHKAVLASCSKVFRAMFEAEMKESLTQEVEISDVDQEAFRVFLDYIYTRKDESMEKHLNELFMLADKYDIQPLINACEQLMNKSLSVDNAFDYLLLADLYRREDSKKSIIDYIKRNLDKVIRADKWVELKSENPTSVSAVLLSMIDDISTSRRIDSFSEIDHTFCDAVAKIGSDEFPLHKFILAEKSPKLAAVFEGDAKESQIEGVSASEFKILMDYLYVGKLPDDHLVNDGILKAAHKFEIQPLVDHCDAALKRKIQTETVVPILICAKSLHLTSLKTSAMDFIVDNLSDVKEKENWKDLSKYPDLLIEIYTKTKTT